VGYTALLAMKASGGSSLVWCHGRKVGMGCSEAERLCWGWEFSVFGHSPGASTLGMGRKGGEKRVSEIRLRATEK